MFASDETDRRRGSKLPESIGDRSSLPAYDSGAPETGSDQVTARCSMALLLALYFKVSLPSVHQMVLTLAANEFIERIPGQGRSIRLLIPREELPDLE